MTKTLKHSYKSVLDIECNNNKNDKHGDETSGDTVGASRRECHLEGKGV